MPATPPFPFGPAMYLIVFLSLIFFIRERLPETIMNNYFRVLIVLQFCLLLSDIFRIVLFGIDDEMFYIPIRIVNAGIIILFTYFFVEKNEPGGLYNINPFFLNVYLLTVFIASLLLYGQAMNIINFGMINNGRTFFGIQLPFDKPVGLFDASDGKLGIMVGPLCFLFLVCCYKTTAFVKVKWPFFFLLYYGFLVIVLQSRSGYLGLALGAGVFILIHPANINRMILAGGTVISVILLAFTDVFQMIADGLVGEGIYEKNVEGRGDGFRLAFEKFLTSPLWGVGHEGAMHNRGYLNELQGTITHNLFLDHLVSGGILTGLPVTLLYVFYFYITVKFYNLAREVKNDRMMGMAIWLICAMVYIVTELNFYRGLYNEFMYIYFAFAAMAYCNIKILKREKNSAYS